MLHNRVLLAADFPEESAIDPGAAKIGFTPERQHRRTRPAEHDDGKRAGPTTSEREHINALE